jgi:hypothetical protein
MSKQAIYYEMSSYAISKLAEMVLSQSKYWNILDIWEEAVHTKYKSRFLNQWEAVDSCSIDSQGDASIHMIALHRHLKLSKRTSPTSICLELKAYFEEKIGYKVFGIYGDADGWDKFRKESGWTDYYSYKTNHIQAQ